MPFDLWPFQEYIHVLSRPMVINREYTTTWTSVYVDEAVGSSTKPNKISVAIHVCQAIRPLTSFCQDLWLLVQLSDKLFCVCCAAVNGVPPITLCDIILYWCHTQKSGRLALTSVLVQSSPFPVTDFQHFTASLHHQRLPRYNFRYGTFSESETS